MTPKFKTALYAGTFNPFTVGHQSIVERGLKICDQMIIAFGSNIDKPNETTDVNYEAVKRLYRNDNRIKVLKYKGLTVDFARENGVDFMIRGVRDVHDFEYERNLADINLKISGIETILLPSLPELSYVSSSMVRELMKYGHDVSNFIP